MKNFHQMKHLRGAWSIDMFNDTEAAALSELIRCLTDHKGDMSWLVNLILYQPYRAYDLVSII